MGLSPTLSARLRASPAASILAVWLMLLQVLFAAEHLSAMAAAASWDRSGAGFLDICHVALDENGQPGPVSLPNGSTDPQSCLLCSAASAAGAAVAATSPSCAHLASPAEAPLRWVLAAPPASSPRLHYGTVRGPPLSLLS